MSSTPSPFPSPLETDRLRLERLSFETVDVEELYRICSSDPAIDEITAHLPWDPHTTRKETHDLIDDAERAWGAGEGAQYVVRPRDGEDGAGEIAGLTSLSPSWDRRAATLGLWLRKRFWGRGYSGERAGAAMAVAFDRLGLELVEIPTLVVNDRSQRAIARYVERYGGGKDGRRRNYRSHGDGVADAVVYSVSRPEWRSATDGGDHGVQFC